MVRLFYLHAWMLGHPIYPAGEGTGFGLFDIFLKFKDTIIAQVSSAGIVIMILLVIQAI